MKLIELIEWDKKFLFKYLKSSYNSRNIAVVEFFTKKIKQANLRIPKKYFENLIEYKNSIIDDDCDPTIHPRYDRIIELLR